MSIFALGISPYLNASIVMNLLTIAIPYCLHFGLPLDQDVYDAAEWSSLVELTEMSINHGSMPVVMPDFTRGEWDKMDGLTLAMAE